jgi:hypothetical protein
MKYPQGMENIILEVKSCSSFMFERYEKSGTASPQHKLQLFHYLKAKDMPEGHIVYICKDDARMLEVGVMNPSIIEEEYKKDISEISTYVLENKLPPLEKPIVYNDETGEFSANWKVGYSNYLTMLYKFENQFAFDNTYKPIAERWNRVLGRIDEGKEMTANNKLAMEEIVSKGFYLGEIIKTRKEKNA